MLPNPEQRDVAARRGRPTSNRAFYDPRADLVAIDLNDPAGAVDGIDIGRATVLVDADGVPRAVEIVGARIHGVDETIAVVARRWRALDRFLLLASAHAALAAPNFEIEVSLHEAV